LWDTINGSSFYRQVEEWLKMHRIGLSAILAGGEWENMKSITKLGR
jgi:hypothetical protein